MPAWSYSALTNFENCPRKFYLTRVAKLVKEPESEPLRWGNFVHKAFEDRLKSGTPLPTTLAGYEGLCVRLESGGELFVEREAAISKAFKPTGWWDKETWCRSKWDVAVKHPDGRVMAQWDWKGGKRKPDSDQMKLFAGIGFLHEPKVEVIITGFVWLKERKIDRETFHRDQAKDIWREFLPRVRRFELAHEKNDWPAKPSGLCRKHCPVGKTNCEFCGS
jgi:hypothetical protein